MASARTSHSWKTRASISRGCEQHIQPPDGIGTAPFTYDQRTYNPGNPISDLNDTTNPFGYLGYKVGHRVFSAKVRFVSSFIPAPNRYGSAPAIKKTPLQPRGVFFCCREFQTIEGKKRATNSTISRMTGVRAIREIRGERLKAGHGRKHTENTEKSLQCTPCVFFRGISNNLWLRLCRSRNRGERLRHGRRGG